MKRIILWITIFSIAAVIPAGLVHSQPSISDRCEAQPLVGEMLGRLSVYAWVDWIKKLSGEEPVTIDGQETRIDTRLTAALVARQPNALAIPFVLEQLQRWYPADQIKVEPFEFRDTQVVDPLYGENLVLTLPGYSAPEEIVLLTAHLDSTSNIGFRRAPGADDNATGSAALLEAARLLRTYRYERTIQLVWFTGEEQGLQGSRAFVKAHPTSRFVGVVNLDMIGYDANNDRCFEIHVGDLPVSDEVGQCMVHSIQSYRLDLRYDYLPGDLGERFSDQGSFWDAGIGAIGVIENVLDQELPNGCRGSDFNTHYHNPEDLIAYVNRSTGFSIVKAGLATTVGLAVPIAACFDNAPIVRKQAQDASVRLEWQPVSGARSYRVIRSTKSCSGPWETSAESSELSWSDTSAAEVFRYYRVEAVSIAGGCVSVPSACQVAFPVR